MKTTMPFVFTTLGYQKTVPHKQKQRDHDITTGVILDTKLSRWKANVFQALL